MTNRPRVSSTRDGGRAIVLAVPARITERDSRSRNRIRSIRRLVAARLSAIWLIVLIVSPWNAPFATGADPISSVHALDGRATVSWEAGTASSEDANICALPPAARRWERLRLEHSIGVVSLIGSITLPEISLKESNNPSPPGNYSSAPSVLRL
jgi:hypothetical protein